MKNGDSVIHHKGTTFLSKEKIFRQESGSVRTVPDFRPVVGIKVPLYVIIYNLSSNYLEVSTIFSTFATDSYYINGCEE